MKKQNRLTIDQFRNRFPNEDSCLDHLFQLRFGNMLNCPKCGLGPSFKRVQGRRAYQCDSCSYQIYPTANTVFDKTTTPLLYWWYSIYLFTTTRNGVAAKELERQLNVCYKTALRMAHQIKKLMMNETSFVFNGEVIIDETFLGGYKGNMHGKRLEKQKDGSGGINKTPVFGLIDKDGKKIYTEVLENSHINRLGLEPIIKKKVDPSSTVVTDGFAAYAKLDNSFADHKVINHADGFYAWEGYSTNRIENYWSTLKRMIKGTHISVSRKHLPKYIAENSFRYVNRNQPEKMFDIILSRA